MSNRLRPLGATLASLGAMLLAGCASQSISWGGLGGSEPPPAAQPSGQLLPASIPAADLVGRWGLAAYHKDEDRGRTAAAAPRAAPPSHKDEDRGRTEAAARGQCKQPYNIGRGPSGGVIMHLADQAQPTELSLKGGADGKNYIGPPAEIGRASRRERG